MAPTGEMARALADLSSGVRAVANRSANPIVLQLLRKALDARREAEQCADPDVAAALRRRAEEYFDEASRAAAVSTKPGNIG